MSSPRFVMALMAVLAIVESATAFSYLCSQTDVDMNLELCINCKTKGKCVTPNFAPEKTGDCPIAGEACKVENGLTSCKAIGDTECSCDKGAQCDFYDPNSILLCFTGGTTAINDCSTLGETCSDGNCVSTTPPPGSTCDVNSNGYVVITPLCTNAVYCVGASEAGSVVCNSGEYFDVAENDCMPLPPVPCAGCGDGRCPDKSDCSKFYTCVGGEVDDEETCSAETPYFDIVTNQCLLVGATCTGNDKCTYGVTATVGTTTTTGATTTTVSSSTGIGSDSTTSGTGSTGDSTTTTSRPAECTAANVNKRYPYEGNCKMYWTCIQVSAGNYAYVASTCLGEYLYNEATGYCDLPANVTCKSTS